MRTLTFTCDSIIKIAQQNILIKVMYLWRMDKVKVLVQMCHYFLEILLKRTIY